MDRRVGMQRLCTWTGVPLVLLLFAGLVTAGFLPPPAPGQSADELTALFVRDSVRIQVGMLIGLLGTGLSGPFVAAITVQLKRIEGRFAPLAYAQLMLGTMLPVALVFGMSWLMAGAYRADRDAQAVQAFSDQAWFLIVGAFYVFVIQLAVIGTAILRDDSDDPLLPRWLGYLNFWCAIGSLPAAGVYFVHDGPLAWNGVLSFWLPATCFGVWAMSMTVALLRAAGRPAADAADSEPVSRAEFERLVSQLRANQST